MGNEAIMHDAVARQTLNTDLERVHCRVHQPTDPRLFTREPSRR